MDANTLSSLILAQELLHKEDDADKIVENPVTGLTSDLFNHIARFASNSKLIVPEFREGLEWINTTRPILLHEDLKGKVVVLDMFTYCCINCMHILPHLHALELQFPIDRGVAVVGVHSAKFENEKVYENVVSAVLRYNISHPVVNDSDGEMWDALSVTCWPTLFILGPKAQILFVIVGEDCRSKLFEYVSACVEYFEGRGELSFGSLPIQLHSLGVDKSHLKFPGKVSVCPEFHTCVAIADTGNHRVLIESHEGVTLCIGGTEPGLVDGKFEIARFNSPQGIVWKGGYTLFVADTVNHAIRKIDIKTRTVVTLVGNGEQGNDVVGGNQGTEQLINSPWDVCLGSWNTNVLLIAMAGSHQIWGYALEDTVLPNGKALVKGMCLSLSGSGNEENRNNSYPHKASFAQPSGICLASCKGSFCLMVADSESSTIRLVNLKTFAVTGIVGGGLDPKDLFSFGDKDGVGVAVKLQHPLAVAWDPVRHVLYVADSYNHKIKVVNVESKTCKSLPIDNLGEPGGLSMSNDGSRLFIADTNNHRILILQLNEQLVDEMKIGSCEELFLCPKRTIEDENDGHNRRITVSRQPNIKKELEAVEVSAGGEITFEVEISLADNITLNESAPNRWRILLTENTDNRTGFGTTGEISSLNHATQCRHQLNGTIPDELYLILEFQIYFCDSNHLCHMRVAQYVAKLSPKVSQDHVTRRLDLRITLD